MHTILSYCPISQSNHYNIMMTSVCTDQYCNWPSSMLELGQWVEQCNLTMQGFQYRLKHFPLSFTFTHYSMPCTHY